MNSEDIPLTDAFYQNPHEYMQMYVRNLNNEIFLSEYHINNLYALLLIGRNSPWDDIKGNSDRMKDEIEVVVNNKVHDVKTILETLSNVYEDKAKKTAINQIEKLMAILKSKKKSIFIEKDKAALNFRNFQLLNQIAKMESKAKEKSEEAQNLNPNQHLIKQGENQEPASTRIPAKEQQIYQQQSKQALQKHEHHHECEDHHHHQHRSEQKQVDQSNNKMQEREEKKGLGGNNQVFSIFYGLANFSNLSALALTNIIEHNSSERFIKFKMSQNYNMTIKNEDPLYFDRSSSLSKLPSDLFVNHLFPFLTAAELFGVRSVCKEWLQNVKQSWHSTFKREMFVQLLACEFCKDIQFYYKTIQLRNPFFQKLSLLIHALIEIIQWDNVYNSIQTNSLNLQLKRILIIILRLTGQQLPLTNLNSINDAFFNEHKHKLLNLKQRVAVFFSALSGSDLTINDIRNIKTNFLDDPFMRVEEMNSEDKSPLLLTLFAKQMALQQILRNHIFLCQEYLLNTKKRLDNVSRKMVYQKGYLQGVYKILLLKTSVEPFVEDKEPSQMPNFHEMLQSIFTNRNSDKPDFVIKNKSNSTQIYLDSATKLDLILTTVYNLEENKGFCMHRHAGTETEHQGEKKEEATNENENENGEEAKKEKNQIINSIDLKIECKSQSENTQKQENHPSSEPQ